MNAAVLPRLALECPPEWEWPTVGNGPPQFTDSNISTFVGGDLNIEGGAAEIEGRIVVRESMNLNKQYGGIFNTGRVGVGSQVVPTPGTWMLAVGSSYDHAIRLQNNTTLEVAHGLEGGGDVAVSGDTDPSYPTWESNLIETNGGKISLDLGDFEPSRFASFEAAFQTLSQELTTPPTDSFEGAVSYTGTTLTLTGGGPGTAGELQVFNVDYDALGITGSISIKYVNIPDETYVAINVAGTDLTMQVSDISSNGSAVGAWDDPLTALVSSRTLWNFPDALDLTLPPYTAFLGSVLVPQAESHLELSTSLNGRVLTSGDMTMNGTGNEVHAYAWGWSLVTSCDPEGLEEEPEFGMLNITKTVTSGTTSDLNELVFEGFIACRYTDEDNVESTMLAPWSIKANQVFTFNGLPIGATCSVVEYSTNEGKWATPQFSPTQLTVPSPGEFLQNPEGFTFEVVNAELGDLSIIKELEGSSAGLLNPDAEEFLVNYQCTLDGQPVDGYDRSRLLPVSGTRNGHITVMIGHPTNPPILFPIGTLCVFEEDPSSLDPEALQPGLTWNAPVVTPAEGVTVSDEQALVTVRNSYDIHRGSFELTKLVEAAQGSQIVELPDIDFTFTYTCTLNGDPTPGFDPTSGEISTPQGTAEITLADGETFSSDQFAIGTTCVLTELTPTVPEGLALSWSDPQFDPGNTITIGDDNVEAPVKIVATNVYTITPEEPGPEPEPAPEPTPDPSEEPKPEPAPDIDDETSSALASTGANTLDPALAGLMLLAVGLLTARGTRARKH